MRSISARDGRWLIADGVWSGTKRGSEKSLWQIAIAWSNAESGKPERDHPSPLIASDVLVLMREVFRFSRWAKSGER